MKPIRQVVEKKRLGLEHIKKLVVFLMLDLTLNKVFGLSIWFSDILQQHHHFFNCFTLSCYFLCFYFLQLLLLQICSYKGKGIPTVLAKMLMV